MLNERLILAVAPIQQHIGKERMTKMEENSNLTFDKNAEERTMKFFSFSAKVFHWCRIFMIPVAVIYAAMMLYAQRTGVSPAGSILLLLCLLSSVVFLPKREKEYQQYAREAQEAIKRGSTEPYSEKALQLRNTQQKAGKGVYYLIAGMVIALGLLCMAGGLTIMLLGGSLLFWGSPILVLSLPCFLLGAFYIGMGKSAHK
jgi:hypothetical protein